MKKLLLMFLSLTFVLTGCDLIDKTEDLGKNTSDDCSEGYEDVDGLCTLIVVEEDNTYAEVVSLFETYIEELKALSSYPLEEMEGMEGNNKVTPTRLSNPIETSLGYVYTREDFSEYDNPIPYGSLNDNGLEFTYYSVKEMKNTLVQNQAACAETLEAEYCVLDSQTLERAETQDNIRFSISGDTVVVEVYSAISYSLYNGQGYQVYGNIVELSHLDGKVKVNILRHNIETYNDTVTSRVYFDQFIEDTHIKNIGLESGSFTYQFITGSVDVLSINMTEEGNYFSYYDTESGFGVSLSLSPEMDVDRLTLNYISEAGRNILSYRNNPYGETLSWNLLETIGWDEVDDWDPNNIVVRKDSVEILTAYDINCEMDGRQHLTATRGVDFDSLSEDELSLANEGLSFTAVTFQQLQTDYNLAMTNPTQFMVDKGFSATIEDNETTVASYVELVSDETFMNQLLLNLVTE